MNSVLQPVPARVGCARGIMLCVNVPYDSFLRQRVLFILTDRLAKTLRSRVYIGEESGVISVGRIEVSGKLRSVEREFKLVSNRS